MVALSKVREWSKQQKLIERRRENNIENQRRKIYYE